MKMYFDTPDNTGMLGLEVIHSRRTRDIHVYDLNTSETPLLIVMDLGLQKKILDTVGEMTVYALSWKWFLYLRDGSVVWYDEGRTKPVRAMDERYLYEKFLTRQSQRISRAVK